MPEELGMFRWIFAGWICGAHQLSVCKGGRKLGRFEAIMGKSWGKLGKKCLVMTAPLLLGLAGEHGKAWDSKATSPVLFR